MQKSKNSDTHTISYSQMKKFVSCPKSWEYKYVQGHKPPTDSIHTIGGTAFHETIQHYLKVLYNQGKEEAKVINLKQMFKERLQETFKKTNENAPWSDTDETPTTARELAEYFKKTEKIFDEFKKYRDYYFDPSFTELVGIEVPIEEEVKDGVVFIGYLDVILKEKHRESYKIVDIKTSTSGWNKWDKQEPERVNQLLAYRDFYANKLGVKKEQVDVSYWIAQREIDPRWDSGRINEWSPPTTKEAHEQVDDWLNEFLRTGFPGGRKTTEPMEKRPEKFKCAFCPFSSQFNGDSKYGVCDQDGERFDSYPSGMKGYIDDKWIDED